MNFRKTGVRAADKINAPALDARAILAALLASLGIGFADV
jgi:hypothetical protein